MDEIRLTCESCGTQYRVQAAAIPPGGREVQCTACGHDWFARPETASQPDPVPATLGSDLDDPLSDDSADQPKLIRPLPSTVLAILREELDFEQRARAAESAQAEDQLTPQLTPKIQPAPVAEPEPAPDMATPPPAPTQPAALPDMTPVPQPLPARPDRRAYRRGFALAASVAALILVLYGLAPRLDPASPLGKSLTEARQEIDQARSRIRAALIP